MASDEHQTTIPNDVMAHMADAMLDPVLRDAPHYRVTLPSGNVVRIEVLRRALAAAAVMGWVMKETVDA